VLERIAQDAGVVPTPHLTREALAHLQQHAFHGNVRELENLLHRAVALSAGDSIDVADLDLPDAPSGRGETRQRVPATAVPGGAEIEAQPAACAGAVAPSPREAPAAAELPADLAAYLDAVERDILVRALERHRCNRTAAGASLGLSLRQMRYRMARLGVVVDGDGIGSEGG